MHTCRMSNASEISLQHKKSCCGNTEMPFGCCENETHTIKLTDSYIQVVSYQLSSTVLLVNLLPAVIDNNSLLADHSIIVVPVKLHDPPQRSEVRYHILFRSLLI